MTQCSPGLMLIGLLSKNPFQSIVLDGDSDPYPSNLLPSQGAGWCGEGRKYTIHNDDLTVISTTVGAADVDALDDVAPAGWQGDVAIFCHNSGEPFGWEKHLRSAETGREPEKFDLTHTGLETNSP